MKNIYLGIILSILGIVSGITAILISWPALAYLGSKLN